MREIRPSGSMSGKWKRSTVKLVRHRQTKGPETDRLNLNHRATSRLYSPPIGIPARLSSRFSRNEPDAAPTLRLALKTACSAQSLTTPRRSPAQPARSSITEPTPTQIAYEHADGVFARDNHGAGSHDPQPQIPTLSKLPKNARMEFLTGTGLSTLAINRCSGTDSHLVACRALPSATKLFPPKPR